MKTFLSFNAALAAIILTSLPCPAQSPRAEIVETPDLPAAPQGPENPGLQTRVFRVPADFLSKGDTSAPDPFASGPPVKRDAVTVLKSLGISFAAPGSTVTYSPNTSRLVVRNTLEQLDLVESVVSASFINPVQQGQVHLEVFSLPPLAARKALMAHPKETELYAWLNAETAKQDGTVKLERHSITIVRGGQKSKTEGIDTIPYPTEFDPPRSPQNISLPVAATSTTTPAGDATFAPWPRTGITPQSIEYRNAGNTFEVELTFGEDGRTVDLNLAPETSRRVGTVKWGLLGEVYQPVFETQKCSAQVSDLVGQPILVSTFSPPVNTGVPDGNKVDRTWLLFVTVKKPE